MKIINRIDDKIIVSLDYAEFTALKSILRLMEREFAYDLNHVIDIMKYLEVMTSDYRDNKKVKCG